MLVYQHATDLIHLVHHHGCCHPYQGPYQGGQFPFPMSNVRWPCSDHLERHFVTTARCSVLDFATVLGLAINCNELWWIVEGHGWFNGLAVDTNDSWTHQHKKYRTENKKKLLCDHSWQWSTTLWIVLSAFGRLLAPANRVKQIIKCILGHFGETNGGARWCFIVP